MARPAPIRLAGTIAATVMCAAAATEAAAQDGSIVLNNQIQLGDVVAGQTLNVVDASDQVTVSVAAQGNSLSGGVDGDSITLRSDQSMQGNARATTRLTLGGDTGGLVTSTTQARANYLAASATDGEITLDSAQTTAATDVTATTAITGTDARLLGGANIATAAVANTTALAGEGSALRGLSSQTSAAAVSASTFAAPQYAPGDAVFSSDAAANVVTGTGAYGSRQGLVVNQAATGSVEGVTSATAGNGWNLAARAHANGNQTVLANQGGPVVVTTDQSNAASVAAFSVGSAFDFGRVQSSARGVGNEVQIGNSDEYVEIDNTQLNTGGVDVSASVAGGNGYDAYVGADAVGNSVVGYACATCTATLDATNRQTNSANVTAAAQATISGSSRAVIAGANATGNAATFYVSKPGP